MITKTETVESIEIAAYTHVRVRWAISVEDNGTQIAKTWRDYILYPDSDLSREPTEVQAICAAIWP